jgi:hypothetical protein|tara:strand:- start:121 stop:381 length:261 start_codon:yes stop_codon:yes gene_type:complete
MQDAAIVLSVMSTPAQQIDSTMQMALSSLYHEHLPDIERMRTWPLLGRRFAIVKETIGWKNHVSLNHIWLDFTFILLKGPEWTSQS